MPDSLVILFLVVEFWLAGCVNCAGRSVHIVPTPEAAAVLLWQQQQADSPGSGRRGALYQLDMDQRLLKDIPFPALEFK